MTEATGFWVLLDHLVGDSQQRFRDGEADSGHSINPVPRMAVMATTGSNATTRQVCSNVRFRAQERTRYAHIEFFAFAPPRLICVPSGGEKLVEHALGRTGLRSHRDGPDLTTSNTASIAD